MRFLGICLALLFTFSTQELHAQAACFKERKANLSVQIALKAAERKLKTAIKKKERHELSLPGKIELLTNRTIRLQEKIASSTAKAAVDCAAGKCGTSKVSLANRLAIRVAKLESSKALLIQKTTVLGEDINAATEKVSEAKQAADEKSSALESCQGSANNNQEETEQESA